MAISVLSENLHIPAKLCELKASHFEGIWFQYVREGSTHKLPLLKKDKPLQAIFVMCYRLV